MNSHSVFVSPAYTRQTTLQCLADMDWSTVISTVVGVIAGGLVNAYFSWQGSKELRREAKALRERTLELEDAIERTKHHIISLGESLEEAGTTKLKKGENGEWLRTVGKSIQILYNVEANEPTDEESSSG
jgi:gas vesicle protein